LPATVDDALPTGVGEVRYFAQFSLALGIRYFYSDESNELSRVRVTNLKNSKIMLTVFDHVIRMHRSDAVVIVVLFDNVVTVVRLQYHYILGRYTIQQVEITIFIVRII
jgi:hypothetical protein